MIKLILSNLMGAVFIASIWANGVVKHHLMELSLAISILYVFHRGIKSSERCEIWGMFLFVIVVLMQVVDGVF